MISYGEIILGDVILSALYLICEQTQTDIKQSLGLNQDEQTKVQ